VRKLIAPFITLIFLVSGSFCQDTASIHAVQTKAIPSTPTNLIATGYSSTVMYLVWDDVADEIGYRVFFSSTSYGPWLMINNTVATDITEYYHENLSPGSELCYRVCAYNSEGLSLMSNVSCSSTPAAISETLFNSNEFPVYFDPNCESVIIKTPQALLKSELTACLYNIHGSLLLKASINETHTELHISTLLKGLYIVRINGRTTNSTKKIIFD
jgi:hypothetical protein